MASLSSYGMAAVGILLPFGGSIEAAPQSHIAPAPDVGSSLVTIDGGRAVVNFSRSMFEPTASLAEAVRQGGEILAQHGNVAIVRSVIPGIIDFYLDGILINNGSGMVQADGIMNYSEISQVTPTIIKQLPESPERVTLEYNYPNGAIIQTAFTIRESFPQITMRMEVMPGTPDRHGLPVERLGMGNFYGVRHNTNTMRINGNQVVTPQDFPNVLPDGYGVWVPENFRIVPDVWKVEYYNDKGGPIMSQQTTYPAQLELEIRSTPWFPEQEALRQENGATGPWFETQALQFLDVPIGGVREVMFGMQ